MRELRIFLTWLAVVVAGFLIYVLWQFYQFAILHPSTMQPWYIGVGVAIGLIAVIIAGFVFAYWREHVRSKRLDNDQKLAALEFDQMANRALETAVINQANHKVGPDRWLEVIYFFPTKVTEVKEDQKQIAAPAPASQLQIPSAPPFSHMAHLMTPQKIILTYTAHGPVYGEVSDLLSMALIGKPKRGKTTALLYYLCILLQSGAEVWVWDPHGEMHEIAYGLHYYDRLEDIAASVPALERELNARDEMYKTGKIVMHPLVLLVDEVPVITDWEREQVKMKRKIPSRYRIIKRFTLEARKRNGYVFISGQSLPAQFLPTLTRVNLSSSLVLECSADHARMAGLPKDAIDTLLPYLRGAERGTHIADFSSWSKPELADIPYTSVSDLRQIIDTRRVNTFTDTFTQPMEPFPYAHKAFTKPVKNASDQRGNVITGELVGNAVNTPVNAVHSHSPEGENVHVTAEAKTKILQLAHVQKKMYGRIVRTKIRDALNWNNKDFPKIKRVLDEEGL